MCYAGLTPSSVTSIFESLFSCQLATPKGAKGTIYELEFQMPIVLVPIQTIQTSLHQVTWCPRS